MIFWGPVGVDEEFTKREKLKIRKISCGEFGSEVMLLRGIDEEYIFYEEDTDHSRSHNLKTYVCCNHKQSGCRARIFERVSKSDGEERYMLASERHICDIYNDQSLSVSGSFVIPPARSPKFEIDMSEISQYSQPEPVCTYPPEKYQDPRKKNEKQKSTPKTQTKTPSKSKQGRKVRKKKNSNLVGKSFLVRKPPLPLPPQVSSFNHRKFFGLDFSTLSKLRNNGNNSTLPPNSFDVQSFQRVYEGNRIGKFSNVVALPPINPAGKSFPIRSGIKRKRRLEGTVSKFYPSFGFFAEELTLEFYCSFGHENNTRIIMEYPTKNRVYVTCSAGSGDSYLNIRTSKPPPPPSDAQKNEINSPYVMIDEIFPTSVRAEKLRINEYFRNLKGGDFHNFLVNFELCIRVKIFLPKVCGTKSSLNCEFRIHIPNFSTSSVEVIKTVGFSNERCFSILSRSFSTSRITELERNVENSISENTVEHPFFSYQNLGKSERGYYADIQKITGLKGNEFRSPVPSIQHVYGKFSSDFSTDRSGMIPLERKIDSCGMNILHYYAANGDVNNVRKLIENYCSSVGNVDKEMENLMNFGVNRTDYFGHTALHFAMYFNHYETSQYLISVGSLNSAKSIFGYTPRDVSMIRSGVKLRNQPTKRRKIFNSIDTSVPRQSRRVNSRSLTRKNVRSKRSTTPINGEEYVPSIGVVPPTNFETSLVDKRVTRSSNHVSFSKKKKRKKVIKRAGSIPYLTHTRSSIRLISFYYGVINLRDTNYPWSGMGGVVLENTQDCTNIIMIPLEEEYQNSTSLSQFDVLFRLERIGHFVGKKENPHVDFEKKPKIFDVLFKPYRNNRVNPSIQLIPCDGKPCIIVKFLLNGYERTKKQKGINRFSVIVRDKERDKTVYHLCYYFKKDNRNEQDTGHTIERIKILNLQDV